MNMSIGIKEWRKAEMENLLISTCFARRIREKAIMDYRERRTQKPCVSIQHCTYKSTVCYDSEGQRLWLEMCIVKILTVEWAGINNPFLLVQLH